MTELTGNVPIEEAAQRMEKTADVIRKGLIQNVFPFGWAILTKGSVEKGDARYTYCISRKEFERYF